MGEYAEDDWNSADEESLFRELDEAHEAATPATGHAEREAFEKWKLQPAKELPYDFMIWQAACAWQRAALMAEIKAGGAEAYSWEDENKKARVTLGPSHKPSLPLYRLPEGE